MIHDYTPQELVARAIRLAKPRRGSSPRWVLVRDLFGVGSTTATQLCREHGFDPSETAGSSPRPKKDPKSWLIGERWSL